MAKTLTTVGGAKVSTTSPMFGTGAAIFDGTGDYITTPDHADFNVGSGNFTIEFWVKRGATGAIYWITGQVDVGGTEDWNVRFNVANTVRFLWTKNDGTTTEIITSTGTITDTNTWHHIAVVRNGNTATLYIDGTADGTVDLTGITLIDPSVSVLAIGRAGAWASDEYNGRVDEYRFSKGIARYTANFTPPTSAFVADSYSVTGLLVHCDGADTSTVFIDDDVIPIVVVAKPNLLMMNVG